MSEHRWNRETARAAALKGGGRPLGARSKLTEDFFRDLQADWTKHGHEVIEAVRLTKPESYLLALSRLMPREVTVDIIDPESALRALDELPATTVLLDSENAAEALLGGPDGMSDEDDEDD